MSTVRVQRRLHKALFYKTVVAAEIAAITQLQKRSHTAAVSPLKRDNDPLLNLTHTDPGRLKLSDRVGESLFENLIQNLDAEESTAIDTMSYDQFNTLIDKYDKKSHFSLSQQTKSKLGALDDATRHTVFDMFQQRRTILQLRASLSDPQYRKALEKKTTIKTRNSLSYFHEMSLLYDSLFESMYKYNKDLQIFLRKNVINPVDFRKNTIISIIARKEYEQEIAKFKRYQIAIQKNKAIPVKRGALFDALRDNDQVQVLDYRDALRFIENEIQTQGLNINTTTLSDLPVDVTNQIQAYKNLLQSTNSNSSSLDAMLDKANELHRNIVEKYKLPNDIDEDLFDDLKAFFTEQSATADDFEGQAANYLKKIYYPDADYDPSLEENLGNDLHQLYNSYLEAGAFEDEASDEPEIPDNTVQVELESSIRSFFKETIKETPVDKLKELVQDGAKLKASLKKKFNISDEAFNLIQDPRGHYYKSNEFNLFSHLASEALKRSKSSRFNFIKNIFKKDAIEKKQIQELANGLLQYARLVRQYFALKNTNPEHVVNSVAEHQLDEFMESLKHNSLETSLKMIQPKNTNFKPLHFKSFYLDFSLGSVNEVQDKLEEIKEFLDNNNENYQKFLKDKQFQKEIVHNQEMIVSAARANLQIAEFQSVLSELKPTKDEENNYKYVKGVTAEKAKAAIQSPITTQVPHVNDPVVQQDLKNGTFNGVFTYHPFLLNYKPTELTQDEIDFGLVQKNFKQMQEMISEHLNATQDALNKNAEIIQENIKTINLDGVNSLEQLKAQFDNNEIVIGEYDLSLQTIKDACIGGLNEILLPSANEMGADALPTVGLRIGLVREDKADKFEQPYFVVVPFDYITKPNIVESSVQYLLQHGANIHHVLAENPTMTDSNQQIINIGDSLVVSWESQSNVYMVLNIKSQDFMTIRREDRDYNHQVRVTQEDIDSGRVKVELSEAQNVFKNFKSGSEEGPPPTPASLFPETESQLNNKLKAIGYTSSDLNNFSRDQKKFLIDKNINKSIMARLIELGKGKSLFSMTDAELQDILDGLIDNPLPWEEGPDNKVGSVPFMITQAMRAELTKLGFTKDQISEMTPVEAQERLKAAEAIPDAVKTVNKPIPKLSTRQINDLIYLGYSASAIDAMSIETAEDFLKAQENIAVPVDEVYKRLKALGYDDDDIMSMSLPMQNSILLKNINKGESTVAYTGDSDLQKRIIAFKDLDSDQQKTLLTKNQAIGLHGVLRRLKVELQLVQQRIKDKIEAFGKSAKSSIDTSKQQAVSHGSLVDIFNSVKADIDADKVPNYNDMVALDLVDADKPQRYRLMIQHLSGIDRKAYFTSLLNKYVLHAYKEQFEARKLMYDTTTSDRMLKMINTYKQHFKTETDNFVQQVRTKVKQQEDIRKGLEPHDGLSDILRTKTVEDFSPWPARSLDRTRLSDLTEINDINDNPDFKIKDQIIEPEPIPLPSIEDFENTETLPQPEITPVTDKEEESEDDIFNPEDLFQNKIVNDEGAPESAEAESEGKEDEEAGKDDEFNVKKSNLEIDTLMPIDDFLERNE